MKEENKELGIAEEYGGDKTHAVGPKFRFDKEAKERFIFDLSVHGNQSRAARNIGVDISCIVKHRQKDSAFDEEVKKAVVWGKSITGDSLAEAAEKIALGWEQYRRNSKGDLLVNPDTGEYEKEFIYDSSLLKFLLTGYHKETFAKHATVEHSGSIEHKHTEEAAKSLMGKFSELESALIEDAEVVEPKLIESDVVEDEEGEDN